MACSSTPIITRDYFMKAENNNSLDQEVASCPNEEITSMINLKPTNDDSSNMSQSVWLFRKYLTRSQSNMGKTSMEPESENVESEIIKKHSSVPRPFAPPNYFLGSNKFRKHRLSLLEQELLPGMQCGGQLNKTSEQLTIFYGGIINVYDNIPADKAQVIMRLAGENSSATPLVEESLKPYGRKPVPVRPKLLSVSKVKAGLPLARRYSLQCFLEKRRGRIINNSPYAVHSAKQEGYEATIINDSNENHRLSLSPFPSRLGYFSPKSTNQGSCT